MSDSEIKAADLLEHLEREMANLPPEERAELEREIERATADMAWVPNPGPQMRAYFSEADQLLYGGRAGGGKSDILLGLASQRHDRSLLLRRQNKEVHFLVERMTEIVGHSDGYNGQDKRWRFSDGRIIVFGGCQHEDDWMAHKGEPKDFLGVDEATEFLESQIIRLITWVRSTKPGQRKRVVFATNPPTTVDGEWVIRWFAPWLDDQHELFGKIGDGELLWCIRDGDKFIWFDKPGTYPTSDGRMVPAISRTFIRSGLKDNPELDRTGEYAATLANLPEALRLRYEQGHFGLDMSDDAWQVIPSDWVKRAMDRWTEDRPKDIEMTAMGVDIAQGGCFDDQTEILTSDGWKLFEHLTGVEQVLTLDGDVAKWGEITELHKYYHDGPLNVLDRRNLSFAITDNHRLLACGSGWQKGNWIIRRYDELPRFFSVRRSNDWCGSNPSHIEFSSVTQMPNGGERRHDWKFDFIDWARFLGWFIAEGCVFKEKRDGGRWRVNISQKMGPKFDRIETLLIKMGIKSRRQGSRDAIEFSINSIGEHLAQHCGVHASNKRIPSYLREASSEAISAFLEEYCLGDGHVNGTGCRTYTTSSKCLADNLHEILAKIGRAGKLVVSQKAGSEFKIGNRRVVRKRDVYSVTEKWSGRSGNRGGNGDSDVDKEKVERVNYSGYVYCVSTPLQTICVRRNGSVMWSGNSDRTVIAPRYGDWFAPIVSVPGVDTRDGIAVAQLVFREMRNNPQVNVDIGGGYGGHALSHLRENEVSVLGFQGNEATNGKDMTGQLSFLNRRAEAWWMFREALDPNSSHKIALPPSPTLRTQLCCARWIQKSKNVIQIESKDDMKARLNGRSPDHADAVIMAWYTRETRTRPRLHEMRNFSQSNMGHSAFKAMYRRGRQGNSQPSMPSKQGYWN